MNASTSPTAAQIIGLLSRLPADLLLEVERQIEELRLVPRTGVESPSLDTPFMSRVQRIAETKIPNSNFGVEWLASELGLSSRQLQRRIRASERVSAGAYLRGLRLQCAAELLSRGELNVTEVADAVGFRNARHFSRVFRAAFGHAPSRYAASWWSSH